jgi:hypothetical protein
MDPPEDSCCYDGGGCIGGGCIGGGCIGGSPGRSIGGPSGGSSGGIGGNCSSCISAPAGWYMLLIPTNDVVTIINIVNTECLFNMR